MQPPHIAFQEPTKQPIDTQSVLASKRTSMGHTTGAKSSLIMENGTKFATMMVTKRNSHTHTHTHTHKTKVIAYTATAFTAGYSPALSTILRDTELQTNLAFKDLRDV